ncbi:MAG: hypothetical protein U0802_13995 [Candidatus Binatia bacterium]
MLLLAPPLGIATGVAAGRLHDWLADEAAPGWARALGPPARRRGAGARRTAAARRPGHRRRFLPAGDRRRLGWRPRAGARGGAADAVVGAWWDYGYWAKYFADRRVNADGGTLLTPVPHWLAHAQLTDSRPRRSACCACSPAARTRARSSGGAQGAMARLMRHGLSERAAYDAIGAVAGRERDQADAHLAGLGLDATARADVLARHCTPPPAVLALSTEQMAFGAWWRMGRWRPDRADDAALAGLITRDWVACALADGTRRCPVWPPTAAARRSRRWCSRRRPAPRPPWPCAATMRPWRWSRRGCCSPAAWRSRRWRPAPRTPPRCCSTASSAPWSARPGRSPRSTCASSSSTAVASTTSQARRAHGAHNQRVAAWQIAW